MQSKNLFALSAVWLCLVASSCANLTQVDRPVCVEISLDRGYCTTIISGRGFYVDEKSTFEGRTWFDQSYEMIRVPVSTWTELKKYLIMNCKRHQSCSENIDGWERSIEKIDQLTKVSTDEVPPPGPISASPELSNNPSVGNSGATSSRSSTGKRGPRTNSPRF